MITLNGEEVAADGTIADLVSQRFGPHGGRGVAVAVNGTVVVRGAWAETVLIAGDRIDIVTAVQGG